LTAVIAWPSSRAFSVICRTGFFFRTARFKRDEHRRNRPAGGDCASNTRRTRARPSSAAAFSEAPGRLTPKRSQAAGRQVDPTTVVRPQSHREFSIQRSRARRWMAAACRRRRLPAGVLRCV
jgi:hypothetical protein